MKRAAFLLLCLFLASGFAGLGIWQVQRLGWKEALIARVNARLAAAPAEPPAAGDWTPAAAYTPVVVAGEYVHDAETLVLAVTDRGPGWWVMTPLRTEDRGLVLVNRGYVPSDRRAPGARSAGQLRGRVLVRGLLRASEPRGGFLRANAPAAGRWYSRDVAAIAEARRLEPVAPYFIDADASPNSGGFPIGGLPGVAFRNDHLVYAATWLGLCVLSLVSAYFVLKRGGER